MVAKGIRNACSAQGLEEVQVCIERKVCWGCLERVQKVQECRHILCVGMQSDCENRAWVWEGKEYRTCIG